jgi:hypothetical protein
MEHVKRIMALAVATALLTMSGIALAGTLTPVPVKTSSLSEGTAAAQGPWFSWDQNSAAHPNHYDVFLQRGSGSKVKVNARGTEAFGGGIDGDTLVYYQYEGRFAGDVMRFDLGTHRRSGFPSSVNSRYDEYHPTISKPWLLFTRYIDDTESTKVILYNLRTRTLRVLATDRGSIGASTAAR